MYNIVLAVDAAKRKSTVGLFSRPPEGPEMGLSPVPVCLVKPFDVPHTREGFARLIGRIESAGISPEGLDFIVESTGTYDRPIAMFLASRGMREIRINPLYATVNTGPTIRKIKTDRADTLRLAYVYFTGAFVCSRRISAEHEDARRLHRSIVHLTDFASSTKARLRSLIGQSFPEIEGDLDLSRIGNNRLLKAIYRYPTASDMASARTSSIAAAMRSKGRGSASVPALAASLRDRARESIAREWRFGDGFRSSVRSAIDTLIYLEEQVGKLSEELRSAVENQPLYRVLLSFPGVGERTALALTAELWDLSAFSDHRKLVSYAGLDPAQKQSGESVHSSGNITKRGNRFVRRALFNSVSYMVMAGGMRDASEKPWVNGEICDYYRAKRTQGKSSNEAKIAAMTKLLRKAFYRFRDYCRTGEITVS